MGPHRETWDMFGRQDSLVEQIGGCEFVYYPVDPAHFPSTLFFLPFLRFSDPSVCKTFCNCNPIKICKTILLG